MRRFYIPSKELIKETPEITGSDAHHIHSVLRLSPGIEIGLFDGKNFTQLAVITDISEKKVRFRLMNQILPSAESKLSINIAQGLLKGSKFDALLKPLTELGVTEIVPFVANRSIATLDEKRFIKRHERWEKIVVESIKQCGREKSPIIHGQKVFEDTLQMAQGADLKLIFWEDESASLLDVFRENKNVTSLFVMIGPEGGFTPEEIQKATRHGFISVSLGKRILRTETAAIAISSILQYQYGDLGAGNHPKLA